MQMIEFSTEKVSADARETGIALLVLFCFALCSAGSGNIYARIPRSPDSQNQTCPNSEMFIDSFDHKI